MDAVIRHIRRADAYVLDNVAEGVFDHDITTIRLAAFLEAPNHLMWVAVSDGLVVGQLRALIINHPDKATDLYIDNLGVAPAHQRQGIAKRLLEEAIRLGKDRGCEEIFVGTETDNEAAHGLYRSLGLAAEAMVVFEGDL